MSLLTDEIKELIGTTRVYTAPEALGGAAGRYYALAVGDDNPLYHDAQYSREHGLAGVTAPPTLICETNQYANLPIGPDGYAGHDWGIEIPGTRKVRGGNDYVFHRRVRPDDVITATWVVEDVVEKTTGGGSRMVIITSLATYADQRGQPLAENRETLIFVELGEQ